MSQFRRQSFLIDSKVQGALMMRVVAYWLYCLFAISVMLILWDLVAGPPRRFMVVMSDVSQRFAPAAAASLILVPLVVMDLLRMTNRFAGPARRLQIALGELGKGQPVPPLMFRDNDFWQEMAAEFNRVNDRITQLAARRAGSQAAVPDPQAVPAEEAAIVSRAE